MNRIFLALALLLSCLSERTHAQTEEVPKSLDEQIALVRKLRPALKILHIAAHPDDENTRLISWLSKGESVEVAYLSLTRGDGGQNLIGPELGYDLGVIRSFELAEARKIDGGVQFFTRAIDFGYSKNPEESLEYWGKDSVLSDVVRVIRTFKPDFIITRFPTDGRGGHGHHTASALLAEEAFDLASNPDAFPEQLVGLSPHSATGLYWNNSPWWDKTLAEQAKSRPNEVLELEVGTFDPLSGRSCNELASMSRSMHKSQGFGIPLTRGAMKEYLIFKKGKQEFRNALERSQTSLTSDRMLVDLERSVRLGQTENALKLVFEIKAQLPPELRYRADLLAAGICGLYTELSCESSEVVWGEKAKFTMTAMLRQKIDLQLETVQLLGKSTNPNQMLEANQTWTDTLRMAVNGELNSPSWLEMPDGRLFRRPATTRVRAIDPASVQAVFRFRYGLEVFEIHSPAVYRWTDRVEGERSKPLAVTPAATLSFDRSFVYSGGQEVELPIEVLCRSASFHGNLRFKVPEGWSVNPAFVPVDSDRAGSIQRFTIRLKPLAGVASSDAGAELTAFWDPTGDKVLSESSIDYPHIPFQYIFRPARLGLRSFELETCKGTVGYVEGAGDEVAEALGLLGFRVEVLTDEQLAQADLSQFSAIVAGIRAYNTRDALVENESRLMEYVRNGGTYLVQYNTNGSDLKQAKIGPEASMSIGRDRVSVETATPRLVDPRHPFLNQPNAIGSLDFENWVQERGLYFASEWDRDYQALISWQDPGEPPRLGGLLLRPYGKGVFVYTGISFFRQLPEGVPGACRLMANLLCSEL